MVLTIPDIYSEFNLVSPQYACSSPINAPQHPRHRQTTPASCQMSQSPTIATAFQRGPTKRPFPKQPHKSLWKHTRGSMSKHLINNRHLLGIKQSPDSYSWAPLVPGSHSHVSSRTAPKPLPTTGPPSTLLPPSTQPLTQPVWKEPRKNENRPPSPSVGIFSVMFCSVTRGLRTGLLDSDLNFLDPCLREF